jgi:hypothetical protein
MPKGSRKPRKKKVSQNGYQRAASMRASAMTDLAKMYPSADVQRSMRGWKNPSISRDVQTMMDVVSEGPSGTDNKWWTQYAIERFANDSAQNRRQPAKRSAKKRTATKSRSSRSKPAIDFGGR